MAALSDAARQRLAGMLEQAFSWSMDYSDGPEELVEDARILDEIARENGVVAWFESSAIETLHTERKIELFDHPVGPPWCWVGEHTGTVGDIRRVHAGAPGVGYTDYEVVRIDHEGTWVVPVTSTVRVLEPWEVG